MLVHVIGLGMQRSAASFASQLESGPILARNGQSAADWLGADPAEVIALDHIFESEHVANIPQSIKDAFNRAGQLTGAVSYLVPGSGHLGDETVSLLTREFDVAIQPGVLATPDAVDSVRIVDALTLAGAEEAHPFDTGRETLDPGVATLVTNFRGSAVRALASARLQRELGTLGAAAPDDMLFIPATKEPGGSSAFSGLGRIAATLRAPDGCPWDRKQTIDSLLPQLDEEICEFKEAWERKTPEDQAEELGDVLFHIVMIAQIAAEAGSFDTSDVIRSISSKMIRRHPHVFGDIEIHDVSDVHALWDAIKQQERATRAR